MTIERRVIQLEQREGFILTLLERQQTLIERVEETQRHQQEQIEEQRRDSQKIHRLWVNLSRKYGWLEDEDLLN